MLLNAVERDRPKLLRCFLLPRAETLRPKKRMPCSTARWSRAAVWRVGHLRSVAVIRAGSRGLVLHTLFLANEVGVRGHPGRSARVRFNSLRGLGLWKYLCSSNCSGMRRDNAVVEIPAQNETAILLAENEPVVRNLVRIDADPIGLRRSNRKGRCGGFGYSGPSPMRFTFS